jgi:protein phosphatase
MADVSTGQPLVFRSGSCTHAGRVRTENEDACLDRAERGLWAVADGMGGHSLGATASRLLMNTLDRLPPQKSLAELVDAVDEAVLGVNARLLTMGREQGTTIGTTFVCLLARGQYAVYAWAGDSRLYLVREHQLRQLSRDHSAVQMYMRQGLISSAQAAAHPHANKITRAVGASDPLYLEMDLIEVRPGDRFLLCSDGLDKFLSEADMESLITIGDVQTSAETLVEATLQNGAGDNVTCVVMEVSAAVRGRTA